MILHKKWIYLPVEVKARELIAKLFFAHCATLKGYGVIIGRNGMNISRDRFPSGVYFDKSLLPHQSAAHRLQVETLGNLLVSLDEETLIHPDDGLVERRFNQESVDLSSIIFAWGEKDSRAIKEKFPLSKKICVTGGPRIDCWRAEFDFLYKPEITDIKRRFGDFILINSNFGPPPFPEHHYKDQKVRERIDILRAVREKFLELMIILSKEFPQRNIVLRPHPGENLDYWERLRGSLPKNTHVVLEGSVSPWLRSASAIVHHCCTTAVEGWMSGGKLISYEPNLPNYPGYKPFHDLPSALSEQVTNPQGVLTAIEEGPACRNHLDPTCLGVVHDYLNFEQEELCSEKMLRKIDELNIKKEAYDLPRYNSIKKLRGFVSRGMQNLRGFLRKSEIPLRYTYQKNPGLNLREIESLMSRMPADSGSGQRRAYVRQVAPDVFCLFRMDKD